MLRNRLVVLGFLAEGPMHGYQIDRQIKQRSMGMIAHLSTASIYNVLNRLAKKGCISVRKEKIGKMPERNAYRITAKGRKELTVLIQDGLSKQRKHAAVAFILSVVFITNISPREALVSLEKRKAQIEFMLSKVKEKQQISGAFNRLYVIDISLKHLKIEWEGTKSLIKKIKTIKKW
ncbi:PadR family transcriptional regulator [bacterium]|nr:PadR family transcriptional regulator [bacterium]